MNHIFRALILASAFLLVSCGDNHDKLMKDQLAWTNEVSEVLNQVADGSLSSSDAVEKIKKLGKEGEEFVKRKEALNKDVDKEEVQAVAEKYRDEMTEAVQGMMKAMMKVVSSGRMTEELQDAMTNMKNQ